MGWVIPLLFLCFNLLSYVLGSFVRLSSYSMYFFWVGLSLLFGLGYDTFNLLSYVLYSLTGLHITVLFSFPLHLTIVFICICISLSVLYCDQYML
jgi:hypothetical protein